MPNVRRNNESREPQVERGDPEFGNEDHSNRCNESDNDPVLAVAKKRRITRNNQKRETSMTKNEHDGVAKKSGEVG